MSISNSSGSVSINANGMTVTDMSLTLINSTIKSKVLINPNDGLKVQKNTGTTGAPVWSDQISLDSNGNALFGGVLSIGIDGTVVKADGNTGLWGGASAFINAPFRVDLNGKITATNVELKGGSLGWGNFNVSSAGVITATGANISGNITANALTAGAFIQAPVINGGTITGTTIQTRALGQYPRAGLSILEDYFEVETSPVASVKIRKSTIQGYPEIIYKNGSYDTSISLDNSGILEIANIHGGIRMLAGGESFLISAYDEFRVFAAGINLNSNNVKIKGETIATQEWATGNVIAKWG